MKLPEILLTISKRLTENGAKAILVGGSVRDHFLSLPIKDYDIEVYGLEALEQLEELLSGFGSVNLVGRSFGIVKLDYQGEEYDFSFPRTEQKTGEGHRGFEVMTDGMLTFSEAAKRRDFTINAMGYDIENSVFIDPYHGKKDMGQQLLRHIDDQTFVEDPLRVYRAVQFSARFGYALAPETKLLCRKMVEEGQLEELAQERVYEEWKKLLLKSPKPSIGFALMRALGILCYFPELEALTGVPQDAKWHPEGDVWVHTMMALDKMSEQLVESREQLGDKQKLKYLYAVLCHDLGKAVSTTIDEEGRIRSTGHEYTGLALTKSLMYRLTQEHDFIESLLPLVEHHLKPSQFHTAGAKQGAIRRLATKVTIGELVLVARADALGRTTESALRGEYPAGEWLLEQARHLKVVNKPIAPILLGRDLIALGLDPSPKFKEILDRVYEMQMDGEIVLKEEAIEYVSKEFI